MEPRNTQSRRVTKNLRNRRFYSPQKPEKIIIRQFIRVTERCLQAKDISPRRRFTKSPKPPIYPLYRTHKHPNNIPPLDMAVHPEFLRITGGVPIQHVTLTPHPIYFGQHTARFPSYPHTLFRASSPIPKDAEPDTWVPGARSALQTYVDLLHTMHSINPPTQALGFLMYIWSSTQTQERMALDPRITQDNWAGICNLLRELYNASPKVPPAVAYAQYVRTRELMQHQLIDDGSRASVRMRFHLLVDATCEHPLQIILAPAPLYVTIVCETVFNHIVRAHKLINELEDYNTEAIRCLHDIQFLLEMLTDLPAHHDSTYLRRQAILAIEATQESLARADSRISDLGALARFAEALHSVFGATQQDHAFETTHVPAAQPTIEQLD